MKKILATGIILLSLGAANAFASQTFSCGKPVITTAQTDLITQFKIQCTNVSGRTFNGFNLAPNQFNDTPATMIQVGSLSCTNFPDPNMGPGDSCTTTFEFTPSQIDTYVYEFIATAGIGGQQYGVFCNNNPSSDCLNIATRPAFVVVSNTTANLVSNTSSAGGYRVLTYDFNPMLGGPQNYTPSGDLFGPNNGNSFMFNLFIDSANKLWTGSFGNSTARRFNFPTGIGDQSPITPSPLNVAGASGIGEDADGNIYVVGSIDNSIRVFDSSGTQIKDISGNTAITLLNEPASIWVTPAGDVYVVNFNDGSILFFEAGFTTGPVAPTRASIGTTNFIENAIGLWIDAEGNVWTAGVDTNGSFGIFEFAADIWDTSLPIRSIYHPNILDPQSVAVDAAGYIYEVGIGFNGVNVFAPDANGTVDPVQVIFDSLGLLDGPAGLIIQ